MMGLIVKDPFRTYPNGFPREVIEEYERRIGRKTLTPGLYRLTITATDATGNRSRPRALRFTIVAP